MSTSQPNGGPTRSGGSSYTIYSDNGIVRVFEPSGGPQQIYVSGPKLEVPRTGGMISSDVLPGSVQLEPCSDNLPDNGFSHLETYTDTPPLPPGLEETGHNYFHHVGF